MKPNRIKLIASMINTPIYKLKRIETTYIIRLNSIIPMPCKKLTFFNKNFKYNINEDLYEKENRKIIQQSLLLTM